MKTPLYKLVETQEENHIFIKRDDLYPHAFGGNKARIALEYIADMKSKGCDCLIGYGNSRSNLNRALAFLAAQNGAQLHIVSPCDDDGTNIETFNSRLSIINGAVFHKCSKPNVAETVEKVINDLKSQGAHPYYINGDKYGKGNEKIPVRAYAKTYYEILEQASELGVDFDYIFLATGTGMTLAGLLTSQAKEKKKGKIIGISIARDTATAEQYVQQFCDQFCKDRVEKVHSSSIHVIDDYRCGGYGKSCEDENRMILEMLKRAAIPLDPTYTGKAFWGMDCYLRENEVTGCNVLFIHTGGTPLFYDHLSNIETIDTF